MQILRWFSRGERLIALHSPSGDHLVIHEDTQMDRVPVAFPFYNNIHVKENKFGKIHGARSQYT